MNKQKNPAVNICIIGTGYVGLVSGACLAEIGHRVVCVDSDTDKINMLKKGKIPIYEEGLEKIVHKNMKMKRLFFADLIKDGMFHQGARAEAVFIAVGTPPRPDGSADLSAIENVAEQVARNMTDYTLIVEKSTVPVETCEWIYKTIVRFNKKNVPFDVASNPEFLREGTAVYDFLNPDRVVLGVSSKRAEELLKKIYKVIKNTQILVTDVKSAELIKHASNSFLSTKISFINAVANICEKTGANIEDVAKGMGLDKRIGASFLKAGIGFGGFCLHPDEQLVVRDPLGKIRLAPINKLHKEIKFSNAIWETLSLNANNNVVEFQPITAVSSRPYQGNLLIIKTKMGKEVTVTEDHPLLTSRSIPLHGVSDGSFCSGGLLWNLNLASKVTTIDWMPICLSIPTSSLHISADLKFLKDDCPCSFSKTKALSGNGSMNYHSRSASAICDFETTSKDVTHTGCRIISPQVGAVRITGIEKLPYKGPVYSIEVEKWETFALSNGLVIHNCFPKDLEAFYWLSQKKGYDFHLLKTVKDINESQKFWIVKKIEEELWNLEGKTIAILGLAFKPNTDDMRFAPSIEVINTLVEKGTKVKAYDPVAMENAKKVLKNIEFSKDAYECVQNVDCICLLTEWDEFKKLDYKKILSLVKHPILIDGRNLYNPSEMRKIGFTYKSVGRP